MTVAPLLKSHIHGTHRLIPPEQTLANVTPHLAAFGITRLADVTGLDSLGIPVYCAIRPQGIILQVSNGKGLSNEDAKVSALMEAVEHYHFENPNGHIVNASFRDMKRRGLNVVEPTTIPKFRSECFFSQDYVIDWTRGQDLLTGREVWLPASAAYLCRPMLYDLSTNGLASGNHILEATLHALYEAIERDAIARLSFRGEVTLSPKRCRVINLETVDDEAVCKLHESVRVADVKLVLIWLKSCIPINSFMAVLLDKNPFGASSTVNVGYGTHLSLSVAATRAITEAAQCRLTFIHGSREDLETDAYEANHDSVFEFFDEVEAKSRWANLKDLAEDDLSQDLARLLRELSANGYKNIYRVDMTRETFDIPVVKVLVCGLRMNDNLV